MARVNGLQTHYRTVHKSQKKTGCLPRRWVPRCETVHPAVISVVMAVKFQKRSIPIPSSSASPAKIRPSKVATRMKKKSEEYISCLAFGRVNCMWRHLVRDRSLDQLSRSGVMGSQWRAHLDWRKWPINRVRTGPGSDQSEGRIITVVAEWRRWRRCLARTSELWQAPQGLRILICK
jgi:hypothetical protein